MKTHSLVVTALMAVTTAGTVMATDLIKDNDPGVSGRNTARSALGGEFPSCTLSVRAVGS